MRQQLWNTEPKVCIDRSKAHIRLLNVKDETSVPKKYSHLAWNLLKWIDCAKKRKSFTQQESNFESDKEELTILATRNNVLNRLIVVFILAPFGWNMVIVLILRFLLRALSALLQHRNRSSRHHTKLIWSILPEQVMANKRSLMKRYCFSYNMVYGVYSSDQG